jgi:hypothetical protein
MGWAKTLEGWLICGSIFATRLPAIDVSSEFFTENRQAINSGSEY